MRDDKGVAEELDEKGEGLTKWEIGFVESVLKQLDVVGKLTPKQSDKLWEIYKEKVT